MQPSLREAPSVKRVGLQRHLLLSLHGNDQFGRSDLMIITLRALSTPSSTQQCTSAAQRAKQLKIIQQQVGHEHASTTAIYTCVSSDFRTRTLRQALDATMNAALRPARRAR